MPTSMQTVVCCDECLEQRQRKDMSPFNAICNRCFMNSYALCVDCGALLRTRSGICRNNSRDVLYDNDPDHYYPLCYNCYLMRRDNSPRWDPTPLDVSFASYNRIHSRRKFAVEVETADCYYYERLKGNTSFGCKTECSVPGMEFISPVLYGDEGLAEIENFLAFGAEHDWSADSDCGCHTHYDMRDDSEEELFRITYAYAKTYRFWAACVRDGRRENSYCHEPSYSAYSVRKAAESRDDFRYFAENQDRYDYLNVRSYTVHNTFENRLLEGTCYAQTICNWIMVNVRFMDYVKGLSFDDIDYLLAGNTQHVLSALILIVGDTDLTDWLSDRLDEFDY